MIDKSYVNVNGANKNPNELGRDIFAFYIEYKQNKIVSVGTYSDDWKSCSVTNSSADCTVKVLIEGKMNY